MTWLWEFVEAAHARIGDREREALWTRGASNDQIDIYRLGYINQQLPDLSYPPEFLDWCWKGRRLRDMFVLPLTNTLGQVKGLQFRHVDPKEKGYSDYTPIEDEPITFGLAQAMPHVWRTQAIWLVEGVFDLFPIQRVHPNVIPTLTNRVSDSMGRLLKRLVTDLWLAFDMDEKGRDAVRNTSWEYRNFTVHDVRFPRPLALDRKTRVKDPSELWETWGDNRFEEFLREFANSF